MKDIAFGVRISRQVEAVSIQSVTSLVFVYYINDISGRCGWRWEVCVLCAVSCTGVRGATSVAEPLLLTRSLSAGQGGQGGAEMRGEGEGAFNMLGST